MDKTPLYDKAVIYEALNAVPAEQLSFLRDFFVRLIPSEPESLTDEEYAECLSILKNSSDSDWFGLDDIND